MIWILQSDWLIRLEKILAILDNLGWYCDVTNVFIHLRQIQIVTRNNGNCNRGIIKFCCKNLIIRNIWNCWTGYTCTCITWFGSVYAFHIPLRFTPVSSTNKTDHHNITDKLLKVTLKTITLNLCFTREQWTFCQWLKPNYRRLKVFVHRCSTFFSIKRNKTVKLK